jgi:carboxymethylenebutenolidase
MVVIHEILGRQPEIDRVVDRFAAAGYAAIAPDLFAAGGRIACIRRVLTACATGCGPAAEQALAARSWLMTEAGIPAERIGIIGFCLGGGFALAVGRDWGAISANYGRPPPRAVMRGSAPVIACYGGRDRVFAPTAARLRRDLAALGVESEVHLFPTAGHSFLTDGDHPKKSMLTRPLLQVRYDPSVAEAAWRQIFGFFDRHL